MDNNPRVEADIICTTLLFAIYYIIHLIKEHCSAKSTRTPFFFTLVALIVTFTKWA